MSMLYNSKTDNNYNWKRKYWRKCRRIHWQVLLQVLKNRDWSLPICAFVHFLTKNHSFLKNGRNVKWQFFSDFRSLWNFWLVFCVLFMLLLLLILNKTKLLSDWLDFSLHLHQLNCTFIWILTHSGISFKFYRKVISWFNFSL